MRHLTHSSRQHILLFSRSYYATGFSHIFQIIVTELDFFLPRRSLFFPFFSRKKNSRMPDSLFEEEASYMTYSLSLSPGFSRVVIVFSSYRRVLNQTMNDYKLC